MRDNDWFAFGCAVAEMLPNANIAGASVIGGGAARAGQGSELGLMVVNVFRKTDSVRWL